MAYKDKINISKGMNWVLLISICFINNVLNILRNKKLIALININALINRFDYNNRYLFLKKTVELQNTAIYQLEVGKDDLIFIVD